MSDEIEGAARRVLTVLEGAQDRLGALDAAAGDGDHGLTMVRGARAGADAIGHAGELGPRIVAYGAAFSERSGGASGALYGALIMNAGKALAAGTVLDQAVRQALDTVKRLGGASVGDKTMVDALEPFCDAFESSLASGEAPGAAWRHAAAIATESAAATADLVASRGRSAALGERSRGVPDPGATSMAIILSTIGDSLAEHDRGAS